jgi:hypothetical protein
MNIARIRNVECYSEDDLLWLINNWAEYKSEKMPQAVSRTAVRTGPESIMHIAIYASEEESDAANVIAGEFLPVRKIASKNTLHFTGK